MALLSTLGKNVIEEEVVNFLRVLVSNTFAWEVKWHNGFEFKVLFPPKGDLTKMTKFNAEMKEGSRLNSKNLRRMKSIMDTLYRWSGCGSLTFQQF